MNGPGRATDADLVQPFRIERANLLGRMVRLDDTLADVLRPHAYPAPVAGLLGEAVALTTLLAAALKYEGVFTLQAQGDGPVGMMVTDVTSEGGVRAYARFDEGAFVDGPTGPLPGGGDGASVPRLLGAGHLAFTVDQGPETDRYQGITELEGATLTECAEDYFRRSEQLPTAIMLASMLGTDGAEARSAGLMIQRVAETGMRALDAEALDEDWCRSVILMGSLSASELLDPAVSANDVLYRLFHEDGVRVYKPRPLTFRCRCSAEKVAAVLDAFSADELADMRGDDGGIVATCEFCLSPYEYESGH